MSAECTQCGADECRNVTIVGICPDCLVSLRSENQQLRKALETEIAACEEAANDERHSDAVREHPNSCGAGMAIGAAEAYEEMASRLRAILEAR